MDVTIKLGEGVSVLSFGSTAIGLPNEFSVTGDFPKEDLIHDVAVCGANPVMGYARDAENCSTLVLLRTLEFMGFAVEWPDDWVTMAVEQDDIQRDATDFGEVN